MLHDWSSPVSILTGLAALILLAASIRDVICRSVPNWMALALVGLGIVARFLDAHLLIGVIAGVLVFVVAVACWRRGWLGGADVKLLAASSIVVPPGQVTLFLTAMALAGAVHAIAYLLLQAVLPRPRYVADAGSFARVLRAEGWRISRRGPLPYVCAITAGFLFVLL
jgi:prepilin peptidase CpaA